ncbi:MAG TPA: hypothetical protein VH044_19460 [Polyangiaceae bacterium]|nr:hypothetical protein [Polyangiaceae bacterium]
MNPRSAGTFALRRFPARALVQARAAAVLGVLLVLVSFGLAALAPRAALAADLPRDASRDPSPDGPWNMTAITETFTVQQWSNACGPAPVTGTAQPSAIVRVRTDGAELAIEGGRRTLRTDGCLDGMPTLASEAHSTDGRAWRTRCSTPPSDPRRATINTAYFLTSNDTIQISETGRYELTINSARCIADVKRDASLKKFVTLPAAAASFGGPTPLPTPLPGPGDIAGQAGPGVHGPIRLDTAGPGHPDCSAPGPAARLEVRPSRKLLRFGDTFAFHAVVIDAAGCVTATPIQWTLGSLKLKDGQPHTSAPTIDGAGKLSVPADCADATFDVTATAAGRSARSSVEVTSPATFEALLAQSGLGPSGEQDEPAVAVLATGSIGATDVRAEDGAHQRRTVFLIVVGALAVSLGIVAVFGATRSRKARAVEQAAESRHAERMRDYERQKRDREAAHAAQMNAHLTSVANAQQAAAAAAAKGADTGPMFCPSCRREFSGGGPFCPHDSNRLVAVAGHQELMTGPSGGICPTCRRGFNPGIKVCPHDGEELVPPGMITAAVNPPAPARGKICPTCGGRFDGTAAFCGKDGTQLVLLN